MKSITGGTCIRRICHLISVPFRPPGSEDFVEEADFAEEAVEASDAEAASAEAEAAADFFQGFEKSEKRRSRVHGAHPVESVKKL